jgi:hypothetical protein
VTPIGVAYFPCSEYTFINNLLCLISYFSWHGRFLVNEQSCSDKWATIIDWYKIKLSLFQSIMPWRRRRKTVAWNEWSVSRFVALSLGDESLGCWIGISMGSTVGLDVVVKRKPHACVLYWVCDLRIQAKIKFTRQPSLKMLFTFLYIFLNSFIRRYITNMAVLGNSRCLLCASSCTMGNRQWGNI